MQMKSGTVISTKMNKTIIVKVESKRTHPKYLKRIRVTKKFYVHDEKGQYKEGDDVTIYETRPLSKLKRWTVDKPVATSEAK